MADEEHLRLTEEIERLMETVSQKEQEIENLKTDNIFLGTLFDGISEEILVLEPDFTIKEANKAFLTRYRLRKADVLGKKCYEVKQRSNAPCNYENKPCALVRAKETGERVETTYYQKGAKGEMNELFMIMYPLKLRGKKIKYFMEIARDVTEYRELIRNLHASENRLRAILDTATDAVLSIDENHRIILYNNAAQRIFGYSREEVLGEDLNLLIPSKYGDDGQYVRRFLETKESDIVGKTISLTGLRKNGEEFPMELSLSFLEMPGGITFTAIIRDISVHQQLEKKLLQSERLAAVGQAAAHVAHEIKNPLMIIGGFSSQIKLRLEDEKDVQKLEMILEEVRRLEGLVANLGDFTKEYRLVKRHANINSVLTDVLEIMRGVCSPEKYEFKPFLSAEVAEISCDPDKLKQVFINIISNGLEAMPDGGAISVYTERLQNGIEVRIADEGIGIPEEDLEHIFEPFYTTRETGSGLGLSISYKIIEAHVGEIWADSRPGKGTSFIIQLPAG
ncbi:MAG: PAS domain S-box protein [Desulfobacteraceae bacterium]|jgi:two-component system sensor kinase FixL